MPPRRAVTGRSQEPRQRYVEELRLLRAQKGDSLRQLGEVLGWDWSLFGKMEKGETLGGPEVAQALDQHYGTAGLLLTLWELAAGDPTQFRERYRRFMALEAKAVGIQQYSPAVVPGLLQTETYAYRLLFRGGLAPGAELDQQVEARMHRREILSVAGAPQFRAILDETVLRRGLLDRAEWQEQLKHLADVAEQPNVTLQILPFAAGLCELPNTDTALLRMPEGRTAAWVETGYDGQLIEENARVERLQFSYDRLRDHALSPRDTAEFILRLLEEVTCPSATPK
ncbi:putative transcriptional regulator [Streptomyces lydicamycinicus]|uniref:Putative transcriptional regulator n=1 Tax=Streptomyces lydicamycinicus TaxID=1546107 RepID=A0A0N7YLS1_9ACTN|nr:helix-turn-helix transcriptional regulator [Streptomyces lydicamycinicus]GAO09595.1 putative transcriptional regulator [Streptomyces lydicamycinicus]